MSVCWFIRGSTVIIIPFKHILFDQYNQIDQQDTYYLIDCVTAMLMLQIGGFMLQSGSHAWNAKTPDAMHQAWCVDRLLWVNQAR